MGNQASIGFVSLASLDKDLVINTWVSTWNEIFRVFTDEQLRIAGETRSEHFTKEIKKHMRDVQNKRFLIYKTEKAFGYVIIQDRLEFIQIYGIAIQPYTILNLRAIALALSRRLQVEFPGAEFRGMVRTVNDRGKALYRYLGAEECKDWHDADYDEHHIPLKISSVAAKIASEKNEKSEIPAELEIKTDQTSTSLL